MLYVQDGKMARIEATFVFPVIQKGFIFAALQTLIEQTPIELRTIVVDQTKAGLFDDKELWEKVSPLVDLYLRPPRNLGFAKGMNEGIIHGLHWGSKYVVACNDDVEFIDPRWWPGLLEQFQAFPEMMAVNPASVIEPGWGYGIGVPGHECPEWGVVVDGKNICVKGKDGKPITVEKARTKEGYSELLELRKGHIEGFAGWCVVFPRETLETVGLYDERFCPGGGEDYDICHRIYEAGGRASATLRSFVWHWWGKSKDIVHTGSEPLPTNRKVFQHTDDLFEHSPDGANSPIFPERHGEPDKPFDNKRKRKSKGVFIDDIR
jgi:glycosyltransferase involved in cell wall biosynthesis